MNETPLWMWSEPNDIWLQCPVDAEGFRAGTIELLEGVILDAYNNSRRCLRDVPFLEFRQRLLQQWMDEVREYANMGDSDKRPGPYRACRNWPWPMDRQRLH